MPQVTLRLTVGTFSVEVVGPPKYAEAKLEELVGRYLSSAKPAVAESRPSSTISALEKSGKPLAPAEFLRKLPHKNQSDRAMALAYYREKVQAESNFTTGELGQMGKETKYPFTNVSDTVAKLASRGLMMSAGDKEGQRAFALTASGEEYIEAMLEAKP
jgi:hypothetical protein